MRKLLLFLLAVLVLPVSCARRTEAVRTLEELEHGRIGVITPAAYAEEVHHRFPKAHVHDFEDLMGMTIALERQQVDAIACLAPAVETLLDLRPDFCLLPDAGIRDSVALAFRKDDIRLASQFNGFLAAIRADGTYDAICANWFGAGAPREPYEPAGEAASGEEIRVGVEVGHHFLTMAGAWEVFGFEPELLLRFGQSIGRPVRFVEISGGGLVPALNGGKIDIVANGVTPTAARREHLLFSEPYLYPDIALIALDPDAAGSVGPGLKDRISSNLAESNRFGQILNGLLITLRITLASIFLGSLLGIVLLQCRLSKKRWLRHLSEGYCTLVEGVPILVFLLIMVYVIFPGTGLPIITVATITYSLFFASGACECFHTGAEAIDPYQTKAGLALGFTPFQTFRHVLFPQALETIMPQFKAKCIGLIENTSIVGFVAIKDLTKVVDIIRSQTYDALVPLATLALIYFILTRLFSFGLDWLGDKILNRHV